MDLALDVYNLQIHIKLQALVMNNAMHTSPDVSRICRSKGPCDVFDPWVRWERGQVGIWEFVRRRRRRPKNPKIKILKIQIRSAQNVGKVWISRKKSSRPYLGTSEAIFSIGWKNAKNVKKKCLFSLVGQWAPIHPVWGHVLLSTRGGPIDILPTGYPCSGSLSGRV